MAAFDVLEAAAAWNLAAAHAALSGPTSWIAEWPRGDASEHISGLIPVRATREDLEATASREETPSVWWTVPEGASLPRDGTPTLHFVSGRSGSLSRCYRRLQEALGPAGVAAGHFVIALAAGSNRGAAPFAEDFERRFGDDVRVLSLAGEAALYRSWVSRVPVCALAPDSREAVALFEIARVISPATAR